MSDSLSKQSIHHLRLSIPRLILLMFAAFSIYVLALGTGLLVFGGTFSLLPSDNFGLWFFVSFASLILFLVNVRQVLDWATVVYYIRNDHQLVRIRGIFDREEASWELRSLKTVKLHQNWIGHLFGFGDLAVTFSSSGYREDVVLHGIAQATSCEHIFHEYLAEATEKKRPSDEEVPAVAPTQ